MRTNRKRRPTHPGEILREDVLPAAELTQDKLARLLGVSRRTVSEILQRAQTCSERHRPSTQRELWSRRPCGLYTGLRSCSISLTVRRETPSKRASLSCVNSAAGKTSSRRISPGCVGRLFRLVRIVHLQPSEINFLINDFRSVSVRGWRQCS